MESLIASNLNELDIGTDVLYDACQKSRSSRDINKAVFEKMLAMEDFNVFKKIMVKRNVQIQYEAMQSYKFSGADDDNDEEFEAFMNSAHSSNLPNPDELEAMIDAQEDEIDKINDPAAVSIIFMFEYIPLMFLPYCSLLPTTAILYWSWNCFIDKKSWKLWSWSKLWLFLFLPKRKD
jgi:hypothetical protein